jgi:mannose-6-phosphate isomerase-like protein (cupin superfamily)
MKKNIICFAIFLCLVTMGTLAQQASGNRSGKNEREDQLDPSPVNPAVDPDINKFLGDWRSSQPRTMYGKLVFHDILTRLDSKDPIHPIKRGAVLSWDHNISYVTLAPGATAQGRVGSGEQQIFYTSGGTGKITVNGQAHDLKEGSGFMLSPEFSFEMTNDGKAPLEFYVRDEPIPPGRKPATDITVMNRFDNDRRLGSHWVHTCNGGPPGMLLCTIPPHSIPQPHSHPVEEIWILVKGESILSLGKNIVRMHPGEAYEIPRTGLAAHSNLNMTDEPIQMIYMGPGDPKAGYNSVSDVRDYASLDYSPITPAQEQPIDMFMGNWRDSFPRMEHGNLYFRDMLTAAEPGFDGLHPVQKGAVLTNARAVSYAMLEPGSTAHKVDTDPKDGQEVFVVNSGTGVITSGSQKSTLSKGMSFIITPGLDFRLTATGDKYTTFYVVSEKLPEGTTPKATLEVVDNRATPQVTTNWVNQERPLITKNDGLTQYGAVTEVELKSMAMSRPYSAPKGTEEIWIATDGDIDMLLGKQLRKLSAGMAYRVPPTGITAHANINLSDKSAEFLYMVK